MDTFQLIAFLKNDKYAKKVFCGVYALDILPIIKVKKPCAFIVNNEKSSLPGEHWFSIYVPKHGPIEYFDSYGLKPLNSEIYDFIKMNGNKFIYNKMQIQNQSSNLCGLYCVFFLYLKSRNYTLKQTMKFFTNNLIKNDLMLKSLFKKLL